MRELEIYFLAFIAYSIIGWSLEMISCFRIDRKIVNRGFLIGPYCPIYGVGAIIMTMLIIPTNDHVATFLKAMTICSILEYITSYIMEKLFRTRWWDYSKDKFNLNGRICLRTMLLFGLGGTAIIDWSNPIIFGFLNNLNMLSLTILTVVAFIIFVTDEIISYNIISKFKTIPREIKHDSTEEITKMVRSELKKKGYFSKRLVYSFPDFKSMVKKYEDLDRQKKIKKEKKKKAK